MKHPGQDIRIPLVAVFLAPAVIFFGLALSTVGRQIGWTDSGELLAVGHTLGIAHPTGYPLLTLLTRVVLASNPGLSSAFVVNVISSVCVSMSVGCVALVIVESAKRRKGAWKGKGIPLGVAAAAFGGACAFGSIATVWDQSVFFEVYALQSVIFAGALYFVLVAKRDGAEETGTVSRYWALAGLMIGFGFANHMSTLYLVPGVLAFSLSGERWSLMRSRWMVAGTAAVWALTLYLYLPIRAGSKPALNWGDPSSFSSFLAHLSGKQYSIWMFTDMKAFMSQAEKFLLQLPSDAGWVVCALSVMGVVSLTRKDRPLLLLLSLLAGMAALYSFTYDILDLEAYFLLFYVVLGVLAGIALLETVHRTSSRIPATVVSGLIVAAGCALLVFRSVDKDEVRLQTPEPFARDVLESVGGNATIFTSKWDFLYSPSLALQTVDQVRPDVLMIDVHLLRDRSWYVRQMREKISAFAPEARSSFDAFLSELGRFERGESVVYDNIRGRWSDLLSDIVRGASGRGPVYVDHEALREFSSDLILVPSGFLLQSVSGGSARATSELPVMPRTEPKNDEFGADYVRFVSVVYLHHAIHARTLGMTARADSALLIAARVDPTNPALSTFQTPPTQRNR